MKRLFDVVVSILGLVLTSPVTVPAMILIWLQDLHSPFYVATRVGRNMKGFRMVKLRSMIHGAHKTGVDSTAGDDKRITWIGKLVRRYKLDELTQLWNVLCGQMSLVGPRPNVEREVALYTAEEKHLLDVRPGITDLASIVFADEGGILEGSEDPDLKYNQVIRPWKSRLGLLYVGKRSLALDIRIIWLTALAIVSRRRALRGVHIALTKLGAEPRLLRVSLREETLEPYPPPGADTVVQSREGATEQ